MVTTTGKNDLELEECTNCGQMTAMRVNLTNPKTGNVIGEGLFCSDCNCVF